MIQTLLAIASLCGYPIMKVGFGVSSDHQVKHTCQSALLKCVKKGRKLEDCYTMLSIKDGIAKVKYAPKVSFNKEGEK